MYKMPSSWEAKCISLYSQFESLPMWSHGVISAQAPSKFHLSSFLSFPDKNIKTIQSFPLCHFYIILASPSILPTHASSSYWLKLPLLILQLQMIPFLLIWFVAYMLDNLPISYYFNKIYFSLIIKINHEVLNKRIKNMVHCKWWLCEAIRLTDLAYIKW